MHCFVIKVHENLKMFNIGINLVSLLFLTSNAPVYMFCLTQIIIDMSIKFDLKKKIVRWDEQYISSVFMTRTSLETIYYIYNVPVCTCK